MTPVKRRSAPKRKPIKFKDVEKWISILADLASIISLIMAALALF